jgi:inorganic pyrophosphatase
MAVPYQRWRPHPWHGLSVGPKPPQLVDAFIEITPSDPVKYEVDKETGYLRVDRPQRTNALPPALYGFVPRTWCGPRVGALAPGATFGDRDPLDICVFSERPILRSEVVLTVRVLGVLRMVDKGEADDKIVAVLANDPYWADAQDITDLPPLLIERLRHYFLTYKLVPDEENQVAIAEVSGAAVAYAVIEAAIADYDERYGAGEP